jgi:hypothetical protein
MEIPYIDLTSYMDTSEDELLSDTDDYESMDLDEDILKVIKRKQISQTIKKQMTKQYQIYVSGRKICPCGFWLNEKNTKEYNLDNMEAGHCVPHTICGEDNLLNLRPICTQCNRGQGGMHTKNLFAFYKEKKGSGIEIYIPPIWIDDYNEYCIQSGFIDYICDYDICEDYIRLKDEYNITIGN